MHYKYVHGNLELLYLLQVCELPSLSFNKMVKPDQHEFSL